MKIKKILAILILSFFLPTGYFFIWMHQMLVTGLNPFLWIIFVLISLILITPFVIYVFGKFRSFFKNEINFTPDLLFAIGLFNILIFGVLSGSILSNSTLNLQIRDTYFVIAYSQVVISICISFVIFSATYYLFPKIFKREMNKPIGYVHFFITLIGVFLIMPIMHYEGLAGMPRRYLDYNGWASFNQFTDLNKFITKAVVIVCTAQLFFIFNFLWKKN